MKSRTLQETVPPIPRLPMLATKRNLLLHPLSIATAIWGSLLISYALHFSALLRFTTSQLLPVTLAIWAPFAFVAFASSLWLPKILRARYRIVRPGPVRLHSIEKRLRLLWRVWLCAAVGETVASGGLPIVWIATNSPKTYFDYGIPSLHGLVNSLLLALALCRFLLYVVTGEKRHLKVPIFCMVWWILLVTRGSLFFIGIECAVVLMRLRPVKTKMLAQFGGVAVCVILLFGWAGDLRTGADTFRELAQPTDSYPSWLPSGILWAYIYATTPLNNLYYSMLLRKPEQNPLLPHTLSILLPTVLRNYVYGDPEVAADVMSGELVESNFNVSTAYSGPSQDFGLAAIFLFSLITASACQWYWYKPGLRSQLIFAVLAQCLVLSLFYDLFLSLPIIAQIGWFYLIFRKTHNSAPRRQANVWRLSSPTALRP